MDSNAQRPSSSSTSSSSNQRSSAGSCGGISSNNSWCSLESVPPPTPFDEKSPILVQDRLKCTPTLDDDDDDEYSDFFTNPCVIDEQISEDTTVLPRYSKEDSESSTILYNAPPKPPTLKFTSSNNATHEDDEQLTSSSPRYNGTSSTHISASNDSGGTSEEEARISSAPICSSVQPEHTLSDISGPCSSSLLGCRDEGRVCGDGGESSGVITASTSVPVVLGSTTTSTSSSLSDTDDDTEGLRLSCRSKSRHEYDLLPPPPPEPIDGGEEIVPMAVDTCEDYWTRLHDIRINGCILEYTGVGKSLHDNGFAQSNVPLTPLNHYFEMTIINPGEHCYIAIGLARKDYNVRKNPGWCSGSIAYHTDDGKIFIGGGSGTPFGPRCTVNDILGCGIIFPSKYADLPEGSTWPWETEHVDSSDETKPAAKARLPARTRHRRKARSYGGTDNFERLSSDDEDDESEDDIWWNNIDQVCEDKVKVFFMRNRKLLGIKEVRIPKGGFYPTIGMMSTNERVSVDLHPLSG